MKLTVRNEDEQGNPIRLRFQLDNFGDDTREVTPRELLDALENMLEGEVAVTEQRLKNPKDGYSKIKEGS
jgi:hypothetical protein